jgi:HEAT repeat protein
MNTRKESIQAKGLTGMELEKYVTLLRNGDNFEKERAIDALVASPGREVIEKIVPLLQESNTPVRMAVLDVLKKIGSVHIDSVISMLEDANEDIRVYGCEVLAFLSDPRSIPFIAKKARDDDPNVRNAACMALGDFDDDEAVNALLEALDDEEWIAFSAIISLGRTKSPKAIPRMMKFFREAQEELSSVACEVLLDYGDDAVLDEVLDVIKGWDPDRRSAYLAIMLEKGSEDIFLRLQEKIGDELYEHLLGNIMEKKEPPVEMVRMLAYFRTQQTCAAILDILSGMEPDNDNYEAVLTVFSSLSDVWGPNAAEFVKSDDARILALIKACALTGVTIAENVLLDRFLNSSVDVKREIVMNVPGIVEGTGCSIIKKALEDTDGHIRGFAVEAVGNLGLKDLKDDVLRILGKDFQDVRIKALRSYIRLDPVSALQVISNFVDEGSTDDKKVYLAATALFDADRNLPFVSRLLQDADESVRRASIGVLGKFAENKKYVELLETILKETEIPHEVLKVIKDKRLRQFKDRLVGIFVSEEKGMWTRYYALSALGSFEDPDLFGIFTRGLEDANGLITIGCIRALADLNDVRAVDHIRRFVDNANDDIRSTAETVLSRMQTA